MKKKTIIICVILFGFISQAQTTVQVTETIVPVEKMIESKKLGLPVPNDPYFKDINNLFDKYVGTWKGNFKNNIFTFFIAKKLISIDTRKEDSLEIHYILTDINGTIIEDTRTRSSANIWGDCFAENASHYMCYFIGKNSDCGEAGTLYLQPSKTNPNEIYLNMIIEPYLIMGDCSNFNSDNQQIFPVLGQGISENMKITKQ